MLWRIRKGTLFLPPYPAGLDQDGVGSVDRHHPEVKALGLFKYQTAPGGQY